MESCPSTYKYILEEMDKGVPPDLSISKKWTNKSWKLETGDLVMLSVDHTPRPH